MIRAVEPVLSDGKLEELENLGSKLRHEREHGSWTSISFNSLYPNRKTSNYSNWMSSIW